MRTLLTSWLNFTVRLMIKVFTVHIMRVLVIVVVILILIDDSDSCNYWVCSNFNPYQ